MRHLWLEKFISRFPYVYWQVKADSFFNDPWQKCFFSQHRWLLQMIQALKPDSVLEAGCGFGRNLKFLADNNIPAHRLTGVDISSGLLAKTRLPKSVRLIRANVLKLPFRDRQFDLVFTHGLLMHLSPRQLPQALSELTRVCQKHLILIEEIRSRSRQINYFTWAHDYDKMVAALPLKVIIKKPGPHSLIWYLLEK